MSMSLGADQLRKIASQMDELGSSGIQVEVMRVDGHRVMLRDVDGAAGKEYRVIGVTTGEFSGGGVMR